MESTGKYIPPHLRKKLEDKKMVSVPEPEPEQKPASDDRYIPESNLSSNPNPSPPSPPSLTNPPSPTRIIFNCYEGSVSHYYHFFYGAMIPMILRHLENREEQFIITTDIGPFKRIFDELFEPGVIVGYDIWRLPENVELSNDREINNIRFSNGTRIDEVVLEPFDFFGDSVKRVSKRRQYKNDQQQQILESNLTKIKNYIESKIGETNETYDQYETFDVIFIMRGREASYDEKREGINKNSPYLTSGKDRRDISNSDELSEQLALYFKNSNYKFGSVLLEGTSIVQQYKLFKNAKIVIGQHGAALSNIFFCNGSSTLIEVTCPQNNENNHFKNLSNFLGINYHYVHMRKNFDNVNIRMILEILERIKQSRMKRPISNPQHSQYRKKYLKYKNKYIQLKQILEQK